MRIGVIADTHGYFDPRLIEMLAGVELILHAGDVGSEGVLEDLSRIAPVRAVRGNVDSAALNLRSALRLKFESVQVEMAHVLPALQSEVEKWAQAVAEGKAPPARVKTFLRNFDETSRVVVFGHSHEPCLVLLGGKLFFNPGSAGKKRFSLPRCCGLL